MTIKSNPLKLNPLQLRTLALLQEMARNPELASIDPQSGEALLTQIPHPHGDHFHIGSKVVAARDASGFANPSVWAALERKGLAKGQFPYALTLTVAGLAYDTSTAGRLLHGADH